MGRIPNMAPFRLPNFTLVPNELYDVYAKKMSTSSLAVMGFILRKTIGFQKIGDHVSISQIMDGLRLSNKTVITSIKELVELDIIEKISNKRNKYGNYYRVRWDNSPVESGTDTEQKRDSQLKVVK